MQRARISPRPVPALLARALLTPRVRAAIARAFKAGRDTGVESDPLAQAEAALQVHPALLPPLPSPPSPAFHRQSARATCLTRKARTTSGAKARTDLLLHPQLQL